MDACAGRAVKRTHAGRIHHSAAGTEGPNPPAAYAFVSACGACFLLGRVMTQPIGTSAISPASTSQSKKLVSVMFVPHKASLTQGMAPATIDRRLRRTSRDWATAAVHAEAFRRGRAELPAIYLTANRSPGASPWLPDRAKMGAWCGCSVAFRKDEVFHA